MGNPKGVQHFTREECQRGGARSPTRFTPATARAAGRLGGKAKRERRTAGPGARCLVCFARRRIRQGGNAQAGLVLHGFAFGVLVALDMPRVHPEIDWIAELCARHRGQYRRLTEAADARERAVDPACLCLPENRQAPDQTNHPGGRP